LDVSTDTKVSLEESSAVPVTRLRRELNEFFTARPSIYWFDFLGSTALFYLCFVAAALLPWRQPAKYLVLVVASLALYRAVIFVHELAHLPPRQMPVFRFVWNLLCGIPLLIPSFVYSSHNDHHFRSYGTARDGEYRRWGTGTRMGILIFPWFSFVAPQFFVMRFLILTPLCWFSRSLRQWTDARASSLVINLAYVRDLPTDEEAPEWRRQELAAFLYLILVSAGLLGGIIPVSLVLQLYLVISLVLFVNSLRLLTAHHYRSLGEPMSTTSQLLDSLNYARPSILIPLWAPVGLRYHALHHLFPGIPYHHLRAAHERIMALLPPDSPYAQAKGDGLIANLAILWRHAR
jgi:fatty acid desaturase